MQIILETLNRLLINTQRERSGHSATSRRRLRAVLSSLDQKSLNADRNDRSTGRAAGWGQPCRLPSGTEHLRPVPVSARRTCRRNKTTSHHNNESYGNYRTNPAERRPSCSRDYWSASGGAADPRAVQAERLQPGGAPGRERRAGLEAEDQHGRPQLGSGDRAEIQRRQGSNCFEVIIQWLLLDKL